jgi:hypothetical protein
MTGFESEMPLSGGQQVQEFFLHWFISKACGHFPTPQMAFLFFYSPFAL